MTVTETKNKKTLEERIAAAKAIMPAIGDRLRSYEGGAWGQYWRGSIQDIATHETPKYITVVALYEESRWCSHEGGVGRSVELSCYVQRKDDPETLLYAETGHLVIRDQFKSRCDRNDLFDGLKIKITSMSDKGLKMQYVKHDSTTSDELAIDRVSLASMKKVDARQ